ncbi:Hsp20/alpha crystallin family protein [Jiangella gansuensis]|uniref:Hsp20/alpha crystallin family protein n=1 Tax=Jiangella gansuensis TaxID=281473 RepID=UPI00047D8D87|nr:HSP20 family small heat-shock protein [Jiangella gansuensis]
MVTRFDPFRDIDRLAEQMWGAARNAATMPMDLYRSGDHYVMHFDLPGIDPGSLDVNVKDRTLTVRAERSGRSEDVEWLNRERPVGTYVRQLNLGTGLELDRIEASYADGVLTLTVPVEEEAKPRRIEVSHPSKTRVIEAGPSESPAG